MNFQSEQTTGVGGFLQREFLSLKTALGSHHPITPGLHTYHIGLESGGSKRLHLRINEDGTGILFVDVTDVIHLNKTACEISKMLLDGLGEKAVISLLRSKYNGNPELMTENVNRISNILDHFKNHSGGCFTCGVSSLMDSVPIFSLPVNAPYKIDVALTYGCNNQCPHCYNEAQRFDMPSLTLENWYNVFDKIADLGIPHVILTGGEATLHPNFLDIVRYADQKGMIVGLNSNGRYLAYPPFMQAAAQAGLNHVQVTLGSCYPEVHNTMMGADSFQQTVKGISTALDSGIHVITNTTLMQSNMGHVDEIIDFIYDLGIRTFAMNGMIYSGGGFSHPSALLVEKMISLIAYVRHLAEAREIRFLWYTPTEYCVLSPFELDVGVKKCNASEYSICVEPNGNVLPCQSYYVAAGNFLLDPWENIWHSELFHSFRDREDRPDVAGLPQKCKACPDLFVCGGGCRIERDAQNGIRVAESAGGGCVGCSNFDVQTVNSAALISTDSILWPADQEVGYIPTASQVSTKRRSSGNMSENS